MKMTKIAAIVAASALLVLGTALTAFAAGWTQVDGQWMYLDKDGEPVTECFKPSGSDMYWLDEDGFMAEDKLVEYGENLYYVDAAGKMVRNQWVEVENTDNDSVFGDTIWYYFQNSGKAIKASNGLAKKTINGKKYMFDDECHMLWGWIDGSGMIDDSENNAYQSGIFYCGNADDGELRANRWAQLYIVEDTDDKDAWFYFDGTGAKVCANYDGETDATKAYVNKVKTIGGKKYAFNEYGVMQAEWTITTSSDAWNHYPEATASAASYGYFNDPEVGAKSVNGWFRAVPNADVDPTTNADDTAKWFYADGKGNLVKSACKTIKGKVYGFNELGEMVSGLQACEKTSEGWKFYAVDDSDKLDECTSLTSTLGTPGVSGLRFFSDDEDNDGSMKTGTTTINIDGDDYSFKFATKGTNKGFGVNGVDGNYYYINGRKFTADGDLKVQAFAADFSGTTKYKLVSIQSTATPYRTKGTVTNPAPVDPTCTGGYVVITSTGAIVKSGTKTDTDGWKFVVKNGKLAEVKDE